MKTFSTKLSFLAGTAGNFGQANEEKISSHLEKLISNGFEYSFEECCLILIQMSLSWSTYQWLHLNLQGFWKIAEKICLIDFLLQSKDLWISSRNYMIALSFLAA